MDRREPAQQPVRRPTPPKFAQPVPVVRDKTDAGIQTHRNDQQKAFPDHKAGVKDDEYGKATKEMYDHCTVEKCKAQRRALAARAFANEPPHLLARLEALLQRRDELFAMGM